MLAGGSLLGSVMIGAAIMVAAPGATSSADAAAPATYAPDMDALLDARSPGGRRYGWLLNTKAERVAYTSGDPIERVLPSVRRRLLPTGTPGAVPPLGVPIIPNVVPEPGVPIGEEFLPGGPGPGGVATPPVGGILPGSGGGGPGGGGSTTPEPDTQTPPAVPEPTTWGMMILGFGVLGIALRRRRSARLVSDLQ